MKKVRNSPFGIEQQEENKRIQADHKNRLNQIRRKLTRGAANVFRTIKTRCKWGSKQLWGLREKGKGKASHHHTPNKND